MIKFQIDLVGGPLDGAIIEVEGEDLELTDGKLEFNGHAYWVTFEDNKGKYLGPSDGI